MLSEKDKVKVYEGMLEVTKEIIKGTEAPIHTILESMVLIYGGWEKIYTEIETGIKNGYSIEFQTSLIRDALKQ